jgi:site-specific DNA recombinase
VPLRRYSGSIRPTSWKISAFRVVRIPGVPRAAGLSQWEREAIGERTRDAMHHKRANGERVGMVPFGYRMAADGLHLEADPAEQGILSRIRELKAAGYTTRRIADELNRQGFTTRHGTAWRFQYVAEALRAA